MRLGICMTSGRPGCGGPADSLGRFATTVASPPHHAQQLQPHLVVRGVMQMGIPAMKVGTLSMSLKDQLKLSFLPFNLSVTELNVRGEKCLYAKEPLKETFPCLFAMLI